MMRRAGRDVEGAAEDHEERDGDGCNQRRQAA